MSGFIEGENRQQATLFPERLDNYIAEDSAVRTIGVFVDDLDPSGLGSEHCPEDDFRHISLDSLAPVHGRLVQHAG